MSKMLNHTSKVGPATFSPDGQRIATISSDTKVRVWDVATGKALTEIDGYNKMHGWLSFSPDGRQIAIASGTSGHRVWDVDTGQLLATLAGQEEESYILFYGADGQKIVSGQTMAGDLI